MLQQRYLPLRAAVGVGGKRVEAREQRCERRAPRRSAGFHGGVLRLERAKHRVVVLHAHLRRCRGHSCLAAAASATTAMVAAAAARARYGVLPAI